MAKSIRMTATELTPQEKTLKRVLGMSRINGWGVVIFAVLGTLIALLMGDLSSVGVGVLVTIGGWMEVHGHHLLKRRNPDGMKWLVRSQLFLLAVILVYCAGRLGSFDGEGAMGNLTPDMEAVLQEAGIAKGDILPLVRLAFFATYASFAIATLIYQGGLAIYYRSKVDAVVTALSSPPRPRVSHLPPSV